MSTEELDKLAKIFGDKLIELEHGVDYTDFLGTAVTLDNIDEVAKHFDLQMREFAADRGEIFDGLQVSFYAPIQ